MYTCTCTCTCTCMCIYVSIYTVVLKKNLRVHERAARVLTLTRKDSHRVRDAYVHFARVNARVSLACHA